MQIDLQIKGLEGIQQKLSPQLIRRGITRAMDDTLKSVKTQISSIVRKKWAIKKSDLDKKIEVRLNKHELSGVISITGKPISLSYFGARQKFSSYSLSVSSPKKFMRKDFKKKQKSSGVSVEIIRGSRRTLSKVWMGVVMRDTSTQYLGVFRFKESDQIPRGDGKKGTHARLIAMRVFTYPTMVKRNLAALHDFIIAKFDARWAHELSEGWKHGKK